MLISQHTIDEISNKADIVSIISEYVRLEKRGAKYWGLSPFAAEKTPSFCVSPDKKMYYCFSTSQGGTIFTFLMKLENLSFPQAAELLAKKVGLPLKEPTKEEQRQATFNNNILHLYDRVAGSFRYIFEKMDIASRAREYMATRKIGHATLERFNIGYAPPDGKWLHRFLSRKGYSAQFLAASNLFLPKSPTYSLFVDRIIFPIHNHLGQVVAFGGRQISSGKGPKYLNSPSSSIYHKKDIVYSLNHLSSQRKLTMCYLAEGYMDVLALCEAGISNAVATLGTAVTNAHVRLLHRYVDTCAVIFDGDTAGRKATTNALILLEREGINPLVCPMQDNCDPADFLANNEKKELENYLENTTINAPKFLLNLASKIGEENKKRLFIIENVFPYLRSIVSSVRREQTMQLVADALQVSYQAVLDDCEKLGGDTHIHTTRHKTMRKTLLHRPELYMLVMSISTHQGFRQVRNQIPLNTLKDEDAKTLYIAAEKWYRQGEQSLDTLLNRINDDELVLLARNEIAQYDLENVEKTLQDIINNVKCLQLEQQRIEYVSQLKRLEQTGENIIHVQELQQEMLCLDAEIEKLKMMNYE